jgi:predicted dehydrogenase
MNTLQLGIIGCGDFLRWQAGDLKASKRVKVAALFDPDRARAEKYAALLGGKVAASGEEIIDSSAIDAVCLFVPPWVRQEGWLRAAMAGKHIIATKPLAATPEACTQMVDAAASAKIRAAVFYRRTGGAVFESYRALFEGGEFGRLALYRQDWLHHYPQWNQWALDPAKNGGPFMDAMIHNFNIACYLMGRPLRHCTFFSDKLAHPDLTCADTESMQCEFDGGVAHLFITWAADLAVHSTTGNDREHMDITYLVTDQGWRLTDGQRDGQHAIIASRGGKERLFPVKPLDATPFDAFAATVLDGAPLRSDLVTPSDAAFDIALLRRAARHIGERMAVQSVRGPT